MGSNDASSSLDHAAADVESESGQAAADRLLAPMADALDGLRQGLLLVDAAGRILAANRRAQALVTAGDGLRRSPDGLCADTPEQTRAQILRIARRTADLVGLDRPIEDKDVVLDTRYAYPAYGLPSAETNEAIRTCARLEGMMTDPVYEGKSMQGMMDIIRKGEIPAGSKVLYAHLGGVPAINAYSFLYRNG